MKRALLIAGGTVGGLGAVLAITPPQLTTTTSAGSLSGSLGGTSGGNVATAAATQAATQPAAQPTATKAVPKSTATKKATAGASASAAASATASANASASATQSAAPAPAPTKTTAAPTQSGYSGTITGATFAARNYGNLTAVVTFTNGEISHVSASQSPTSWSQQSLTSLIPYVSSGKITVAQIKSYAAEQLPCAISNSCRSQASFTATAFWESLKSAISKAGL
jgi:hypothetical protein